MGASLTGERRDQRGREDDDEHAYVLHQRHQPRVGAQGVAHRHHSGGSARQRPQHRGLSVDPGDPGEHVPGRQAQDQGAANHERDREPVGGDQEQDRGREGGGEHAADDRQGCYAPPARNRRVLRPRERHHDRHERRSDEPRRRHPRNLGERARQHRTGTDDPSPIIFLFSCESGCPGRPGPRVQPPREEH